MAGFETNLCLSIATKLHHLIISLILESYQDIRLELLLISSQKLFKVNLDGLQINKET